MVHSKLQNLKVSDNGRFLVKEDGTPFFWLGDTAWELFHKLNREDTDLYLTNRAERGFNVVQAVALSEDEGITRPNAYGRTPLLLNDAGEYDPTLPDTCVTEDSKYSFWDHVDYIVDRAGELGIYIAFLPTWGDKFNRGGGKGPEIFNGENARKYGRWLGQRYKDRANIIWVLGGDRSLHTNRHFDVVRSMAEGLKEGDEGRHLMTFHPYGGSSSSHHVHEEKWLDFNMMQSGHGALNIDNYRMLSADYARTPVKPVLDGEPRYEDHPISFNPANGYFDDYDIRQAAYWSVFAGALGHTYGHHSIWIMCTEPGDYFVMTWKAAILRPGGSQVQHLRKLIESRPFLDLVPDQNLIAVNYNGANHMQAARGSNYAFVYSPNGLRMKISMGIISGSRIKAWWYDPRTGVPAYIGEFDNQGTAEFMPPSSGRKNDWVLVLDDAAKGYPQP